MTGTIFFLLLTSPTLTVYSTEHFFDCPNLGETNGSAHTFEPFVRTNGSASVTTNGSAPLNWDSQRGAEFGGFGGLGEEKSFPAAEK